MLRLSSVKFAGMVLFLKSMNLVFITWSVSLFEANQVAAFPSSSFVLLNRSLKLGPEDRKVVSSANSNVNRLDAAGRSFMKRRNNKGPSTEPCGTPHVIVWLLELTPLICTNCFLFVR